MITVKRFMGLTLAITIGVSMLTGVNAQEQQVSGKVVEQGTNESLAGASVLVKGTTTGTVTDINGEYSLNVAQGATLVVSFIGYSPQEMVVGAESVINFSLELNIGELQEVVVIGYGTQEKKDVTGAISSLNGEELESIPVPTVESALQGRMAGVQVVQTGGVPGGASTVKIRGIATINNDEPLYVIDGIPIQAGTQDFRTGTSPLNAINPSDIESIEVLKDASAAAIYGARASAGVILITTKRGKSGTLKLNYHSYIGVTSNDNGRIENTLTRDNYIEYAGRYLDQRDADVIAGGGTPEERPTVFSEDPSSLPSTDWFDEVFQNGRIQKHNFALSGGSAKSNYLVSLDYFEQEGTINNTGFERSSLRINSDHTISKFIRIGQTLNLSYTDRDRISSTNLGLVELASRMTPLMEPLNPDFVGGFNQPSNEIFGHEFDSPLIFTELIEDNQKSYNILGNVYLQIDLLEGLNFRTNVGVNFNYEDVRVFRPRHQLETPVAVRNSYLFNSRNQNVQPVYINSLNFERSFGHHHVSAVVATEKVENTFTSLRGSGENLPASNDANELGNVDPDSESVGGSRSEWGLMSYLGRVSYNFKDRYYVTASLRRDGSSRLDASNQYENFPSLSLGWRMSEEAFMQNVPIISNLKFRGGYGEIGNVSSLPNYPTQVPVQTNITYVLGENEEIAPGATVQRDANRDIRWELVKQTNIGVDLGLFKNRLLVTADYFFKETSRMIFNPAFPASAGTAASPRNIGSIENQGYEIAITHQNTAGDFSYSIGANITVVNNELTRLTFGDDQFIFSGNSSDAFGDFATSRSEVGGPLGQIYGYVFDGIHQQGDDLSEYPNAQPGDIRYRNINSVDENGRIVDGVADSLFDSNDRTVIGDPLPSFTYGINMSLGYKGFDLSMLFQGSYGNDIYNTQRQLMEYPSGLFNKTEAVLDAWTPANTETDIPRYNVSSNNYVRMNSRYVEDGSYLRLKNITLGYTLPQSIIQQAAGVISSVRIYGSAQNLFTITDYTGLDPEVGADSGSALALGIDNGSITPIPRIFIMGIQVSF